MSLPEQMMQTVAVLPTCPLCSAGGSTPFHRDSAREYLRCANCRLVFVPRPYLPEADAEKAVYDLHENEVTDPGYRRFLAGLAEPLLERLSPGQQGLDFGCGPGPALAAMLREDGHAVALYDPFYFDNPQVLKRQYDFVCATEVVEHFHDPQRAFALLFDLLRPGGWLGLMTWQLTPERDFGGWSYIRDETHVCFYGRETFEYLAQRYDAELQILSEQVLLFRAPGYSSRK